jgi:hypothetical protein
LAAPPLWELGPLGGVGGSHYLSTESQYVMFMFRVNLGSHLEDLFRSMTKKPSNKAPYRGKMNSSPTGDSSVSAVEPKVPVPPNPRHTRTYLAVAGGGHQVPQPQEDEWKEVKRKRAKRPAETPDETRDSTPPSPAKEELGSSTVSLPSAKAARRKAKAAAESDEDSGSSASAASSGAIKVVKGRPHRKHVHRGVGKAKAKPKTRPEPEHPDLETETPFQRLVLQGAADGGGMDTADALLSAMRARQLLSDWRFPEGIPPSAEELHLRLAEMIQNVMDLHHSSPLPVKEPFYVGSWALDQIPPTTELSLLNGAAPRTIAEYARVFGQRQPVLPPYMLAYAASLVCARILVLEPVVDSPSSADWNPAKVFWRVARHFWPIDPCNGGQPAPRNRVIMLAAHYGSRGLIGHSWVHPDCVLCDDLPGCGTKIKLDLSPHPTSERFEDWCDDRGTDTAHPYVSSEEEEPDRSPFLARPVGPPADGVAMLMDEHPSATERQARNSMLLTRSGSRYNLVAASKMLGAELAVSNPERLPPPLPANTGKRAARNAAATEEDEERLAAASPEDAFILAQGQALANFAILAGAEKSGKRDNEADQEHEGSSRSGATCKPPPRRDRSPPASGGGSGEPANSSGRQAAPATLQPTNHGGKSGNGKSTSDDTASGSQRSNVAVNAPSYVARPDCSHEAAPAPGHEPPLA